MILTGSSRRWHSPSKQTRSGAGRFRTGRLRLPGGASWRPVRCAIPGPGSPTISRRSRSGYRPAGSNGLPAEESRVVPLIAELSGDRAPEVLKLLESFDSNHPAEPPHFYLSLLGTNPRHRGEGLGMALLAENLAAIDIEAAPAYLESSNAANDFRYEGCGFRRIGGFDRPDGQTTAATMWREPSGRSGASRLSSCRPEYLNRAIDLLRNREPALPCNTRPPGERGSWCRPEGHRRGPASFLRGTPGYWSGWVPEADDDQRLWALRGLTSRP